MRWLTIDPARGRQAEPVWRSNWSAAWSRKNSNAVAAFDQRLPLGGEAFQFDRADFGAVLFLLAALLRLLVVVEFALDPVDGAVEEIDRRPEQVFEVGFEARVGQRRRRGRRRCRRRRRRRSGLRAAASGRVRPGRGDSRRAGVRRGRGRSGMRCAAARSRCRRGRSSWCFPSSDRPRPSRPSWRRKAAGGPDLHPERSEGPKRSGGWRGPAILPRDVKAGSCAADGK